MTTFLWSFFFLFIFSSAYFSSRGFIISLWFLFQLSSGRVDREGEDDISVVLSFFFSFRSVYFSSRGFIISLWFLFQFSSGRVDRDGEDDNSVVFFSLLQL